MYLHFFAAHKEEMAFFESGHLLAIVAAGFPNLLPVHVHERHCATLDFQNTVPFPLFVLAVGGLTPHSVEVQPNRLNLRKRMCV